MHRRSEPCHQFNRRKGGTRDNPTYNLYGTTAGGGAFGAGIAFELSPAPLPAGSPCPSGTNPGNGWCEQVIYNFCSQANCADGSNPTTGLVRDSAGNFYGANSAGVFELYENSGAWSESVIYTASMSFEYGSLALDAKGNLYGADANQHIFKLSKNSHGDWVATNIHTFKAGSNPVGTPALDGAGNVYGMTVNGGSNNYGTVWKLTLGTTGKYTQRILHSFTSVETGYYPQGGVTLDSKGNIYGTTMQGGAYYTLPQCQDTNLGTAGCGTVFELALSGTTYRYKLLLSFNGTDGALPLSNPILGSSGQLYGTTFEGSDGDNLLNAYGGGAAFEVTP